MSFGILIGFVLRKNKKLIVISDKLTVYAIWVLLFLLGISVGTNETIIQNIGSLGFQALVVTLSSIACSVIFSYFLFVTLFKNEK